MDAGCARCGCAARAPAHVVVAALAEGDLDRALDEGLLDLAPCDGCAPACRAQLQTARAERLAAFAARARHRARAERLARREAERAARRAAVEAMPDRATSPAVSPARAPAPALPAAAAAALARALAKAGPRRP